MKIGILTLPFNNNYGGYLQAFALMTVLKGMGCDVEMIYRRHNRMSLFVFCKKLLKNIIKKCLRRKVVFINPNREKEYLYKGEHMIPFVKSYIQPMSRPLYSSKSMNRYINANFDAVIVGSDQVWRPDYVPDVKDFFFCNISGKIRRAAYAASFGCDNPKYEESDKALCGRALENFKAVGLREKGGLAVMKKMGWRREAELVLDPTMLLAKERYECVLNCEKSYSANKMLLYILDDSENVKKIVDSIRNRCGLEKDYIMDPLLWKQDDYQLPSIEKWLRGIHDAKVVVTDSFHGMVFSIIFNRPFWVIVNKERGADRFESLLSVLNLQNRMISSEHDFVKNEESYIDWDSVNKKLDFLKKESITFLRNALN